MKEYIVVTAQTIEELEEKVNTLMKRGAKLSGGIVPDKVQTSHYSGIHPHSYLQAMYFENEPKSKLD